MADDKKPQRAYASGTQITLGLLSLNVDLVPVKVTGAAKAGSFHRLCPECETPTRVEQRYVCESDHGPYELDELTRRGKTIDDTLVEVSDEEVAAVNGADIPKGQMSVELCPADQFERECRPDGNAYRLRPNKGTPMNVYAAYVEMLSDRSVAAIGELNLRDSQKQYRLEVWRGQLVVQGYLRPDDLAETETIVAVVSEAEKELMAALVKKMMGTYDREAHLNMRRIRDAELVAAKAADPTAPVSIDKPAAPAAAGGDLAAALAAMLEAA